MLLLHVFLSFRVTQTSTYDSCTSNCVDIANLHRHHQTNERPRTTTSNPTNHAHPPHHPPPLPHLFTNNMRRPRHAQTTHHPHPQPTTPTTIPHAAATRTTRRRPNPNHHSPHHSHQLRPLQHHHRDSHAVHCGRDDCCPGSGADVVCGAEGGGL